MIKTWCFAGVFALAGLTGFAQASDLDEARLLVAQELKSDPATLTFSDEVIVNNKKIHGVCGTVNGRKFIANLDRRNVLIFKYDVPATRLGWHVFCEGASDDAAIAKFKQDIDEDVCTIKDWSWREFGTRSIKIEGISACNFGELRIKAFDGDRFIGFGDAKIDAGVFRAYIDGRPSGSNLRIEYAFRKAAD